MGEILWRRARSIVVGVALVFPASVLSQQTYYVTAQHDVVATMRDGVKLRADIYRPKADGKFPVLLVRTPYDKTNELEFGVKAAGRGYVVVAQDVRGRYQSEGEWYPFKNESQDGYDTVEWAAALPYASGKVGMFGGSYVGATQFLAAIAEPPHLAGICPNVTASNYHDGWTYQGGAFEQWFNESWSTGLAENTMHRRVDAAQKAIEWTKVMPLSAYPVLEGPTAAGVAPYFSDWLAHPNYDEYWKQWSIEDHYAQVQVPVFNLGAWYDIFLGGTLRNYERLKKEAGTEEARRGQKLMVYVGGHAGGADNRKVGAVDFGERLPFNFDEVMLNWYERLLKGERNGVDLKPVKIFVMGKNEWREEDDWPLARANVTKYYLHSNGGANGSEGDGTLSPTAPASEKADQFTYDPNDPVPTLGGPLCCGPFPPVGLGPQDQSKAESRKDVLVFTTGAMTKDLEVTGPVLLDFYVSSSGADTDFTGKLVDLWPNGLAQNLTEGILRMRYRDSQEKPQPMKSGEVYHVKLDLWATSNVFLTGHKLRLEVSSSNFPRFDRNLNTAEEQAGATRMSRANNVVYHDKAHPSALILPIIQ